MRTSTPAVCTRPPPFLWRPGDKATVLRKFLAHVTTTLSAHRSVCDIDNALKNGNHRSLIKITGVKSLLSCDVEEKYQKLTPVDCLDSLRKPIYPRDRALGGLKALRHGPPTRKQLASKSGQCSIIVSDWSKISFNFTAFPHENYACG